MHPALRKLPVIVAAGVALRVAWVCFNPNDPVDDQLAYLHGAETLAGGRGFESRADVAMAVWPPGYSVYLALFFRAFGVSLTAASAANIVLGALGIVGVHRLCEVAFGARAAPLAAWAYALYPGFVVMACVWCAENLYCAAVPWLLWLVLQRARGPAALDFAIAALIAVMVYVRSAALLLVLLVPAALWLHQARALRSTLLVGALVFVALLPWGFRNQRELGEFSLLPFNGGTNLWIANHPGADGSWMRAPADIRLLDDVQTNRILGERARAFIHDQPLSYLALCGRRTLTTLRSDTSMAEWNREGLEFRHGPRAVFALKCVCSVAYWLLLLSAAASLYQRRTLLGRTDALIALGLLLLSAPFVLIIGGNRFLLPLLPLLMCWAARFQPRALTR